MNDVSLKEFIERIIAENNKHRDAMRTEDSKALKLIAEQTKMSLEAYPTLRDFNNLKNRVDVIVALFKVVSSLSVIAGAGAAFFALK